MAGIVGSAESFARGLVDAVAEVAVVLDERARRLLLGAAACYPVLAHRTLRVYNNPRDSRRHWNRLGTTRSE
ncbi:MAG: hypothetical protein ACRDST_05050 [Pseudonocardiaceae bacterium]